MDLHAASPGVKLTSAPNANYPFLGFQKVEAAKITAMLRSKVWRLLAVAYTLQLNEHPPGPPDEFGQEPHGLGIIGTASVDVPVVAKTDNCFSRSFERQLGHSGTVLERTSASNA